MTLPCGFAQPDPRVLLIFPHTLPIEVSQGQIVLCCLISLSCCLAGPSDGFGWISLSTKAFKICDCQIALCPRITKFGSSFVQRECSPRAGFNPISLLIVKCKISQRFLV